MEGLEHEADPLAPQPGPRGLVERAEIDAVDRHAALVGVVEPGEDVEQRRFADPGFADDRDQFARADLQIEMRGTAARPRHRLCKTRQAEQAIVNHTSLMPCAPSLRQ